MKLFKYIIIFFIAFFCYSQDRSYDSITRELQKKDFYSALNKCKNLIKKDSSDSKAYAYLSFVYFTLSEKRNVDVDRESLRQRGIREGDTYLFKEGEGINNFLTMQMEYNSDTLKLSEEAMLNALRLKPGQQDYIISLGQIYFAQRNHDKLFLLLKSMIDSSGNWNTANIAARFAINYFQKKNYDRALDIYRLLISKLKSYSPAISDAGTVFILKGQIDSSIIYLKEAYKINPQDSLTIQSLAQLYIYKNYFDTAAFYKEKIYNLDTNNLVSLLDLGFLYYAFDKKKSIQIFDKFIEKTQKREGYKFWNGLVRDINKEQRNNTLDPNVSLNRSESLNKMGYRNYALILLSRIIKSDSGNSPAFFNLAMMYRSANLYSKAIECLTKCEQISADLKKTREVMEIIFLEKARTFLLMQDYRKLYKYAKLLIEVYNRNSSESHYLLGLAYLYNGKDNEGFHEFQQAIDINDNKKIVEQARVEIDNLIKK